MIDQHTEEELVFDFDRWMSRQDDDLDVVRELPAIRQYQETLPGNSKQKRFIQTWFYQSYLIWFVQCMCDPMWICIFASLITKQLLTLAIRCILVLHEILSCFDWGSCWNLAGWLGTQFALVSWKLWVGFVSESLIDAFRRDLKALFW